jgi:ubiquinone/menaquinone biosynthesis C-methylase UbiE
VAETLMEDAMSLSQPYQDMYEGYYGADAGLERKRAITAQDSYAHICRLVGDEHFGSIVDVGAGQGSLAEQLSRHGRADRIAALEISGSGLEAINRRALPQVEVVRFDGYTTAYPDKQFDLAVSFHVIEHVEHERLFLRELKRISKRAIIEAPLELTLFPNKNMAVMAPFGHINSYTVETFRQKLETSGLKPLKINVCTYSLEYDLAVSGRFAAAKNFIRRNALKLAPKLARMSFVYLATALCDCSPE